MPFIHVVLRKGLLDFFVIHKNPTIASTPQSWNLSQIWWTASNNEWLPTNGMTYDWRTQTMEEYQNTAGNQGSKFHFISSVHSIYYVPDLQASLKDLYDRLESKGMMLIVAGSGTVTTVAHGRNFTISSDHQCSAICSQVGEPLSHHYLCIHIDV